MKRYATTQTARQEGRLDTLQGRKGSLGEAAWAGMICMSLMIKI